VAIEFENPLVAGTVLVRSDIRSQDFVEGSSGWRIEADGSAEFNNVVIRGTGTDPAIIVGPDGAPQVIIYNTGVNGVVELPTNDPNEASPARLASVVYNQGAATERLAAELQGPAHDVDSNRLAFQINSTRADSGQPANATIFDVATQNLIFYADNIRVQVNEALQVAPEAGDTLNPFLVNADPPAGTFLAVVQRASTNRFVVTYDGRIRVTPESSADSAVFVDAASGYTGRLIRAQLNGSDRFTVEPNGNANVVGTLTAGNQEWGTAQTAAPGAGGGTTSVSVNFAKTFPQTPRVLITASSTADPGTTTIRGYVNTESTTGFTITAYRSTNAATNWRWWAVSDA
jgi:hypothetical protein